MMNQLAELVQVPQCDIDVLRVFYYRYSSFGLLSKATFDYQRCFGLPEIESNHVCLQFGQKVYEVSLEGSTCFDFTEAMFDDESLVYFYECDIKHIREETKRAVRFALDYDVLVNRKLDTLGSLRYLKHWLFCMYNPLDLEIDFNLKPGTIRKHRFNLPYTCATQVAFVFLRLFDLIPMFDNHLPTTLLWLNLAMSDSGTGILYEADS